MSSTEYSRKHQLRVDDAERDDLARLVMAEIAALSHALNAAAGGTEPEKRRLRRLRSLLERLTD